MAEEPLSRHIWLQSIMRGGIVAHAETALKIAEILLMDMQGLEILEQQRPLVVFDRQDRWLIEGSINNSAEAWRGATRIAISKADCQVLDLHLTAMRYIFPDNGGT